MKRIGAIAAFIAMLLAVGAQAQLGGGLMFPGPGSKGGGAGASTWCSLIPSSGLVNCWPFDTANTTTSSAADLIGGKTATFANVTLNGSGPSTNLTNAAVFNGSTSKGDTTLANVPLAAFSIVMWVNTSNSGGGPRAMANDNTGGSDNNGFNIAVNTGNPILRLGNGITTGLSGVGSISAATWTMITYTYDGSSIVGYVGGTLTGGGSLAGPQTAGSNNVGFGYNPAGSVDFWPGMLAGVAVYNRVLTAGEVATINGL